MINLDEDALVCDLAETYGIYDYRSLPVHLAATLSVGLREDSRIRMKAAEVPASTDTLLLALVADRIALLLYDEKDRPPSILEELIGEPKGTRGFDTPEAFHAELARIRGE